MKKSEFVSMIREIVAEELRRQLPALVSEMYIKRLMSEEFGRRTGGESRFEAEMQQRRDEMIPEPMDNDDEGIYDEGPFQHESLNRLLSPDNPLSSMYSDITSKQRNDVRASSPPISKQLNTQRFAEVFRRANKSAESNKPMQQSAVAQERELEMRRKRLDEQFVDTSAGGRLSGDS